MKYHAETKEIKSFNPITLTIIFENITEVHEVIEAFQKTCFSSLKDVSVELYKEIKKNNH